MNIEARLPEVGTRVLREQPEVRNDLDRIFAIWRDLLSRRGGPLLFGRFSVADAYFAPVVMRLLTYGVPVPADLQTYLETIQSLHSVAAWRQEALAEKDFRPFEEPYRQPPSASHP